MPEDLKRQAVELYKERTTAESLPTSDSLSTRRLTFISLGIVLVLVVVIQALGGLSSRQAPVKPAATKPLPLPPEPAEPRPSAPEAPAPKAVTPPAVAPVPVAPSLPAAKGTAEAPSPPPAAPKIEPSEAVNRELRPALRRQPPAASPNIAAPERAVKSEPAPAPLPEPAISPAEVARQELARDIALGKIAALAKMIAEPGPNLVYQGWKADAAGTEVYHLTFTFTDKSSGTPLLYVWRVDMKTRSTAPLSYYARKLP